MGVEASAVTREDVLALMAAAKPPSGEFRPAAAGFHAHSTSLASERLIKLAAMARKTSARMRTAGRAICCCGDGFVRFHC